MFRSGERRFLIINHITIISLFVLILAGGVVRSSGSGMGCPDWPKCFGKWIPPTDVSELPDDYQEKYVSQRVKKNERFARTLDLFGFSNLADQLRTDKSVLEPELFNASKTWTEYINRLIGALTGLFLLACAVFSIVYLKVKKRIFFLSVFNLLLVVFQAWLGSIVVSTNLVSWIVTVHMLIAIAILAISIYTYYYARVLRDRMLLANKAAGNLRSLAIGALILTVLQITLGTEVREAVDEVAGSMNYLNRSEWVTKGDLVYIFHSNMAILVFGLNVVMLVLMRRKYLGNSYQFKFIVYIFFLILAQLVTGITLAYLALPPIAQAAHILLATLTFGAQFYLLLILKQNKMYKKSFV
ncbi:COX15/CtaA family protein [Desertivirga brevis]|uniref:COX15/CtaA family protein n=1 Tax=Desertivirga brevis TaxID=2810310 RepID=UPI001A96366B|nr:COX15/CtaA family protein [Pedobacter sp. SYSU D00873]